MLSVTLATHCHSRDLPRLHTPGELEALIASHSYPFNEVLVTHQRTGDLPYTLPDNRVRVLDIQAKDYEWILGMFGIDHQDPLLTEVTHGWNAAHYFAHHCVNHCLEIIEASSDYIIFSDADCRITSSLPGLSWVEKGIQLMEQYLEIFVVSPSEGGHEADKRLNDGTRLTQTMSQQLFMGKVDRLRDMNFTNLKWDGNYDAPYGPLQEFYGMFEGHIWRWMRKYGLYRAVLPELWRYWHYQW